LKDEKEIIVQLYYANSKKAKELKVLNKNLVAFAKENNVDVGYKRIYKKYQEAEDFQRPIENEDSKEELENSYKAVEIYWFLVSLMKKLMKAF
jgi:hypothetical protein